MVWKKVEKAMDFTGPLKPSNIMSGSFLNQTMDAFSGSNYVGESMQREANAQNQRNLETAWSREDNAVQRRMEDLKKAGLSPILAAGGPAAGAHHANTAGAASHGSGDPLGKLSGFLEMRQLRENIKNTKAQNSQIVASANLTTEESRIRASQRRIQEIEEGVFEKFGILPGDKSYGAYVVRFLNSEAPENIKNNFPLKADRPSGPNFKKNRYTK